MRSVYWLTLRQLSGRWRLAIIAALASLPVLITTMMLRSSNAGPVTDFETTVLGGCSPEPSHNSWCRHRLGGLRQRDRGPPLANLTIRPVLAGRSSSRSCSRQSPSPARSSPSAASSPPISPSGRMAPTIAIAASAIVGVAMYASMFVWLGLVVTGDRDRPAVHRAREGFFTGYVPGVRLLSIRYHAIALMHGLDPRRFAADQHVSLAAASAVAVVVIVGFLWLSLRRLRTMDVP